MSEEPGPGSATSAKPWSGGGREELADAVRRLMTTVVAAAAPPDVVAEAARRAAALADELERYVPEPGGEPTARYSDEVERGRPESMAQAMPFDMIVGSCNPVAPPIAIEFAPPKAIGTVLFPAQYEGAPGCVHGAALAGAFDIVLTAANFMAEAAGPTVELTIRYRKPTLMAQPAVFEGWVTERTARRIHSAGRLIQGDVVTVEATGVFVDMERSRIQALHRRPGAPSAAPPTADGH